MRTTRPCVWASCVDPPPALGARRVLPLEARFQLFHVLVAAPPAMLRAVMGDARPPPGWRGTHRQSAAMRVQSQQRLVAGWMDPHQKGQAIHAARIAILLHCGITMPEGRLQDMFCTQSDSGCCGREESDAMQGFGFDRLTHRTKHGSAYLFIRALHSHRRRCWRAHALLLCECTSRRGAQCPPHAWYVAGIPDF